jgi:peptidoglycan/xylan/chitin deacetylase (PgdA/CDA1 family)
MTSLHITGPFTGGSGPSLIPMATAADVAAEVVRANGTYAPLVESTRLLRPSGLSAPAGPSAVMIAPATEAGHGWVGTPGAGTANVNDTSDFLLGSQSIKLVTTGSGAFSAFATKSSLTYDLTGRVPVLWVKCDDVTKLKAIEVRLGDATFANFFYFEFESAITLSTQDRYIRSGVWHKLVLPWGAKGTDTGTPNRAALTQVRVTPLDNGTGPVTIHVNGFGYQPEPAQYPNGVVSICCDDGWVDGWNTHRPALDKYGYVATAMPIVDRIGNFGTYMTLAQLKSLQDDYGWEIAAHAFTDAAHTATGAFSSLSAADLEVELRSLKQWGVDNGFRGFDYFAYPQGVYNDAIIANVKKYFAAARSQHIFRRETLPVSDRYRTRTVNLGSPNTLATIQGYIDEASANKEWINFTTHKLGASATDGSTWAATDFASLLAYINGKGMAVRTYGQVLRSVTA